MRQDWSPEEVVGEWTLVESDWKLIANKSGSTRLGFALTLKLFEIEARFPLFPEEIPQAAIDYVAGLVQVPATEFAEYELASSSAATVHRQQIREAHRFRVSTRADEEQLTGWLASEVCPAGVPIVVRNPSESAGKAVGVSAGVPFFFISYSTNRFLNSE